MRMNYYILSEKRMYSSAVKMLLDELGKMNKIYEIFSDLKQDLENSKGTVVILGPNTLSDPYEICQSITRVYPLTAVLLLLNKADIDYKKAMFSGAVDVVDIDTDETELVESFKKAEQVISLKQETDQTFKRQKAAKVITVCSTKGGVGKTTISVNTAVALNKHNLNVAVIDLDLQFGDISLLFDEQPSKTIYDWVKQSYENGDKSIDDYLVKTKMGIDILAAPTLPEFAELITGEHIAYLIETMKLQYDAIVIDTPPAFVDTSLVALEHSDHILLIASLDLPALKNGKLAIDTLNLLGLKEKISIVLNRDSEMEGMTMELIENVLGMKIHWRIPSDYRTVISSINKGEPFVLSAPRTPVAKAMMKTIEQLLQTKPDELGVTEKDKKKRSILFFKK
ncbi:AAA family ATPase [Bacillus sp. Marseille-P3661]|uniref:AAA family ATPase n=1 Tax=Bacillus sp. Marseille-P3661 TaxID=1936234 RepID=UPI000C8201A5|nr:AAA family ATPase [Bacillus sp. Marseille-P3661]